MRTGLSNFTSNQTAWSLEWRTWLEWLTAPRDPQILVLLAAVVLLVALGRRNSGLARRN